MPSPGAGVCLVHSRNIREPTMAVAREMGKIGGIGGDFLCGAVLKNPSANSGDTGSSPGPGRSHMPQSNKARAPQLLSPRATTTEARVPRARALQQEKPP